MPVLYSAIGEPYHPSEADEPQCNPLDCPTCGSTRCKERSQTRIVAPWDGAGTGGDLPDVPESRCEKIARWNAMMERREADARELPTTPSAATCQACEERLSYINRLLDACQMECPLGRPHPQARRCYELLDVKVRT